MNMKTVFLSAVLVVLVISVFAVIKFNDSIRKASDARQDALNDGTIPQNEAPAPSHDPDQLPENADQPKGETITPTGKPDANDAVPTYIAEKDGISEAPPNEPLGITEPDETTPDTNEVIPSIAAEKDRNGDMPPNESPNSAESDEKTPDTIAQEKEDDTNKPDPKQPDDGINYKAFFTQEGEAYTLIADSLTKSFLVLDNASQTIRSTDYKYISYFEDFPEGKNPILGSKGDLFVFLAHHEVVASDGKKEWVLTTVGEADVAEKTQTGYIMQNGSKILANIFSQPDHVLLFIDLDTPIAYKFPKISFHGDFLVFTDDYVFFGLPGGNMTSGYRCPLYKVHQGEIEIIGVIPKSETYEFTLEENIVKIKLDDLTYCVDLESNQVTSSVPVNKEFSLYYPVFCNTVIGDLTEMKFIHDNQVQSILLPDEWKARCTYFGEKWSFTFDPKDADIKTLPRDGYFNRLEPYENQPIPKFPESAAVKELLYFGTCFLGECEIYLLERSEPYHIAAEQNIYEMIYAYIPYEDGAKAYELNIYVPLDEDYETIYAIIKKMLRIE